MDDREEIIQDRKLVLCPSTIDWSVPELLQICPECDEFLLYCCACNNRRLDLPRSRQLAKPCHHFRIVFTDGACTNNGHASAKAGAGAAYGNDADSQLSQPITDSVDEFPLQSNQRAELCAAKVGVKLLSEAQNEESTGETEAWIIATDSEYVVKGITEWLPRWKRNNWHTSKGTKPVNLDLFLALDETITTNESKGIKIGMWHIPREHNRLADRLAKAAAVHGEEVRLSQA